MQALQRSNDDLKAGSVAMKVSAMAEELRAIGTEGQTEREVPEKVLPFSNVSELDSPECEQGKGAIGLIVNTVRRELSDFLTRLTVLSEFPTP